jgi:hypothetical protein
MSTSTILSIIGMAFACYSLGYSVRGLVDCIAPRVKPADKESEGKDNA